MKIDFIKIINIKSKDDLKFFSLDKPIFNYNYLFHYLIMLDNLSGLKLVKFPIYIENNDGLNGFHLAAKENNIPILEYLISEYPEYIYNRNHDRNAFTAFLELESFTDLILKFPKLDWKDLINSGTDSYSVLKAIVMNLNKKELDKFIKVYNIRPDDDDPYLFGMILNNIIDTDDKIKLLDNFTDRELNIKTSDGEGLIYIVLQMNDKKLFEYLLKRNIDIDYLTFKHIDNPFSTGLYIDIMINNNEFYSRKIFEKINTNSLYKEHNRYGDNIAHTIIFLKKRWLEANPKSKKYNVNIDQEILENCDSTILNQKNVDGISPLDLLVDLDFNSFEKVITKNKNKIQIDSDIIKYLESLNTLTQNEKKWLDLYKSLPKYIFDFSNVILDFDSYAHSTLFQAKFKDISIFLLYLKKKYSDLYIPSLKSYLLNDLSFNDKTISWPDNLVTKRQIFPWIITYFNEKQFYIYPYLNNLINGERRSGNKKFALVFLSLSYPSMLHANVLFYDFKNMTVERFEPYGNVGSGPNENKLDDVLEEELTWNTGLKYLRPKDYLPQSGFQDLSNERHPLNKKAGDFGGFCLAWCLWYIETRLKNQLIEPKILIEKIIQKILVSELKLIEYIRNYSSNINKKRIEYLKNIGLDEKNISNTNLSFNDDSIIENYLINNIN
jgi:hypothetical protein